MEKKKLSKINIRKNPDGSTTKITKVRKIIKVKTIGKPKGVDSNTNSPQKDNLKSSKKLTPVSSANKQDKVPNATKPKNAKNKNKIFIKKKKPEWSYQKKDNRNQKWERGKSSDNINQGKGVKVEQDKNPIPKEIEISDVISIKNLSLKLNLKASEVMKKVFSLGVMGVTINDNIDAESAQIVCSEFGCQAKVVSLLEQTKIETFKGEEKDYVSRSPIVTIMGHVDHGKTTLLDSLRESRIVQSEAGGITQGIGAYKVKSDKGEILFIDTPGHSAFSKMRSRGSSISDIIILVVSAVDGVMPQTLEVIEHAQKKKVPIIVAINKMDLEGANPQKTIQSLSEHGLISDQWGGDTIFQEISALKKTGLDKLLNAVSLQAEILGLKGNRKIPGYGHIIESELKKGLGNTISVVLKNGSLKIGNVYICGSTYGKIRALFDENNKPIKETQFSNVVKIIGLPTLISAGEFFQVVSSEKEAKKTIDVRKDLEKQSKASNVKKVTLGNLYDTISEEKKKEHNVIIKADTFGVVEAIKSMLIDFKNDEIKVVVVSTGVGSITENDLNLAIASNAEIIGFKVKVANSQVKKMAQNRSVKILYYEIIYDIVDNLKKSLTKLLDDEFKEILIGSLIVKNIFKISKQGNIAGCEVKEGKILKSHTIKVIRDGNALFKGKIDSLKRFKDDVKEVGKGLECGVAVKNFEDLLEGDVLETYEIEKKEKVFKID